MAFSIKQPKLKEKKQKFDASKVPVYALESPEDYGLNEEETIAVWQHNVNNGMVWHLQGWYGRNAQAMLDNGILQYPEKRTHDYYGHPIPTKKEKKAGKFLSA